MICLANTLLITSRTEEDSFSFEKLIRDYTAPSSMRLLKPLILRASASASILQTKLDAFLSEFAGTPVQPPQNSSHASEAQIPHLSLVSFLLTHLGKTDCVPRLFLSIPGMTFLPSKHRHSVTPAKAPAAASLSIT